MKTFSVKERRPGPATVGRRPSVHALFGPVQRAQQARIGRILRSTGTQAKLTIDQPGDRYEREADRVADQVMAMPDPGLQRQPENEEEEKPVQAKSWYGETLQRLGGNNCPRCAEEMAQRQPVKEEDEEFQAKEQPGRTPGVTPNIESRINGLKGGGQPLDPATRAFFEPRFGQDFSSVRVHQGGQAADISHSIGARAFTLGNNVVFGSGEYRPESSEGKRLLGHELTHVVQQGEGAGGDQHIRRSSWMTIARILSCMFPYYPGMGGLTTGGKKWYPHDYLGSVRSPDVRASASAQGYSVPRSPSPNYNCMRWAVGHGAPSSPDWLKGAPKSSSDPWPEERFLKTKIRCRRIKATDASRHKVKLYEYLNKDEFHIVRQDVDGTWSSKTGAGPLFRGIKDPDAHTAAQYQPINQMRSSYWSCP